ncbi:hypothetical protein PDE_03652 [Penicillium oxalicum 114-2]|uniref:SAP domain-containing protein n=1 Tax=Penicillium oxalicum (strain 114-2 / CGMCC 5302) TaxID=933388 RepID=S7ZJ40_PENO1|nr:hypothetical protein PDE_03652 [Penicillium oxalicum 114-2]
MRPSSILYASRPFPWIAELKAVQLQRVARATGIQSSGTKHVLGGRIETILSDQLRRVPAGEKQRRDWSVLSIDMGIRNLAFAHLHVPRVLPDLEMEARQGPSKPILTAWHRLKVSEIDRLDLKGSLEDGKGEAEDSGAASMTGTEASLFGVLGASESAASASVTELKESFAPHVYAELAYTLVTALLSAYKPTHVLIERQRFRSGGGSAVQEWTLRVGVFEGMLYAVLNALKRERGFELDGLEVHGIEPKRVVRYWEDLDLDLVPCHGLGPDTVESGKKEREREEASILSPQRTADDVKTKSRVNARQVKQAKIDLVGHWIAGSLPVEDITTPAVPRERQLERLDAAVQSKICLAAHRPSVHQTAQAYLQKWRKPVQKTSKNKTPSSPAIGKLDDLADCLLQGVTWLEWQTMRERLAREGVEALQLTKK